MIQAMYNGVSGLRSHKTMMDVISNNIANINTIGYKAARVSFKEMFSQTLKGATAPRSGGSGGTNPAQIGLGSSIGSIDVSQNQGSLQPTGKITDLAIEGNGCFIMSDGQGMFYSRDGSFIIDSAGNLVSAGSGLKVLGWKADRVTGAIDSTSPISSASVISLPVGQLARQTTEVTYGGNLDSSMAAGETHSVSALIYDSLGTKHTLWVTFTKNATANEWAWEAVEGGAAVGSGTITFDGTGKSPSASGTISLPLTNGANTPLGSTLSFGAITQLAGDTTVSATSQNGLPLGMLDSFTIGKDGVVSGVFTNGTSQPLAQIALSVFSNPSGLNKVGNNLLVESSNSGLPQIGQPSVGSIGKVIAGFLESSNVDLPTEFANMIVAQRGFQANSRIITTSDEILQELVQIKR